jgi:cytochrome c peroxidase
MRTRLVLAALALSVLAVPAQADPARQAILDRLAQEARQQDKTFTAFSAQSGQAFFMDKHAGGKPDTPSCTTCHTSDPKNPGQTKAGKEIKPMAVSKNPARFTDQAELDKWFGRNCNQVLGRECTASEKGNVVTYLMNQ